MMSLSASSYYYDPRPTREQKEIEDADLRGRIEAIRIRFPRAGYRPLLHYLKRDGIHIGETRLRRILGESGLFIRPKKRFVKTTQSDHSFKVPPNHLHNMAINNINQVWVGDITYIRIMNGFIFLAVILDLYSRRVVGWSISKKIDGKLTVNALNLAIATRKPPKGVIHHSDRGSQYLCEGYRSILKENGFISSCSNTGNPYENAWSESFMKTLKYEEIYMFKYNTYLEVINKLPRFIEEVYNRKRLHSSLNYLPPEEFEAINKLKKEGRPVFTLW